MPISCGRESLQQRELLASLEALFPQLYDVDAAGQNRVEKVLEVAATLSRVRAQVEPGVCEARACVGDHRSTLAIAA